MELVYQNNAQQIAFNVMKICFALVAFQDFSLQATIHVLLAHHIVILV